MTCSPLPPNSSLRQWRKKMCLCFKTNQSTDSSCRSRGRGEEVMRESQDTAAPKERGDTSRHRYILTQPLGWLDFCSSQNKGTGHLGSQNEEWSWKAENFLYAWVTFIFWAIHMILGTLNTLKKNFFWQVDGLMDGWMDEWMIKEWKFCFNTASSICFLTGPPCFFHLVTLFL